MGVEISSRASYDYEYDYGYDCDCDCDYDYDQYIADIEMVTGVTSNMSPNVLGTAVVPTQLKETPIKSDRRLFPLRTLSLRLGLGLGLGLGLVLQLTHQHQITTSYVVRSRCLTWFGISIVIGIL
ncbi:GH22529 [Drosophila grimshawi]|uniref:GH22529 n=1 Tax=Drosophila grimshawi TaxID=7222 RepID=B4K051_DROGR|nr:GH22529 [Drosophila grimshawi]